MNILQVNKYYFLRGGAERYLFDATAWLEHEGHTVIPFAMQHPSNVPTPFAPYFVSSVETQKVSFGLGALKTVGRMNYSFEARRQMDRLIRETRPDLAHVHNVYTQLSPSVLLALKQQRIPVVMTVHDHHLVSPQYNIWAQGCGEDLRFVGLLRGTALKFHKDSHAASFAQVQIGRAHV